MCALCYISVENKPASDALITINIQDDKVQVFEILQLKIEKPKYCVLD